MGKKLQREFDKHMKYVAEMCDILESPDEYRALVALKALMKKQEILEGYIEEVVSLMDVDNIGNAINRIKARLMGRVVSETLPDELKDIPEIWLRGRPQSKDRDGFPPYTLFQAERQHRRLLPYLEDVWSALMRSDADNIESVKEEVLATYQVTSPEEMARMCYAYDKEYNIEPAYTKPKKSKLEEATCGEMSAILEAMTLDYGVRKSPE